MKKLKMNAGITLVALIITIIVLLILAVVSIRAITGGEGIFTKTENATQRYKEERIKEENTVNGYENAIDKYMVTEKSEGTKYYVWEQDTYKYVVSLKTTGNTAECNLYYFVNNVFQFKGDPASSNLEDGTENLTLTIFTDAMSQTIEPKELEKPYKKISVAEGAFFYLKDKELYFKIDLTSRPYIIAKLDSNFDTSILGENQ